MPDLPQLAARMIGIGFGGATVTAEAKALIARGVRNVIFFARNVESAEQFADLTREVKSLSTGPILTCVDQEGGRVMRLREPFTIVPSMRQLGQADDERLAYQVGRIFARELRAVNIDMDLAPVLDVDTNPGNPVISSRSFGDDVDRVTRLGVAVIRGLQDNDVAACAKHFPGHGDTNKDSHKELPILPHDMSRLLETELPPFEAAVGAGVAAVMTAHVIYTPVDEYPATLSHTIIDGILRKRFNYDGYVMSDDMQMKAIADHYGFDDAVVLAINAGVDLLWICHNAELQDRAMEAIISAVEEKKIAVERIERSVRRFDALAQKFVRPAVAGLLDMIGSAEHRAVVEQILARAETDHGAEDPTAKFVSQQKT